MHCHDFRSHFYFSLVSAAKSLNVSHMCNLQSVGHSGEVIILLTILIVCEQVKENCEISLK